MTKVLDVTRMEAHLGGPYAEHASLSCTTGIPDGRGRDDRVLPGPDWTRNNGSCERRAGRL